MKKFVKNFVLITFFVGLTIFFALGGYILSIFLKNRNIPLNMASIITPQTSICVVDEDGKTINEQNTYSKKYTKLREMPPHLYQAFISIEDKNFYTHKGINLPRILGATVQNIKNKSFSQGASTISQQLIKNTHLSSEKTINRKVKEIILTKKLEKKLSKEEILESYLNVIYFGNNCYGITEASNYYFSKSPKDLNLTESATLAGIIKSPSKYSPTSNPKECKLRRNVVLKEMTKDKKISEEEYENLAKQDICLKISSREKNNLNTYSENAIDEAISILHLPAKQIALAEFKIHTYQNQNLQKKLENAISSTSPSSDFSGIVIDNASHGIKAYTGKGILKTIDVKRQPGSCIKPILVYAPALNEDIISPETQILDEKITIGEYSPENIGGKFHGYISAKEALSKSINIPAIKILSYTGINKAKKYAQNMGFEFDKQDNSYALGLGGMTYGISLKNLANAYSTFANQGNFCQARFVSHITDKDGKIIYKNIPTEKRVLRKDTCYLMTDMLKETAKNGTAKKLNSLGIEIASKTGTVGKKGSDKNLDAWNISYTPELTFGVWMGNLDNSPISIAGGNQPTQACKNFFEGFENKPFEKPNEVVEKEIDLTELEQNHRVQLASPFAPQRYKKTCLFSRFNLPPTSKNFLSETSKDFSI